MPRFAVAAVYEGDAKALSHELYIVRARSEMHADGIGLRHARENGRRLVSLLVTPAIQPVVHG